jgi:predicted permease
MRDVRLAVRALLATPVVSVVAVLSLTLGVGANSAIFSLLNTLVLRELPVHEPERLVTVSSDFALGHGFRNGIGWSYDMWRRFEQQPSSFDSGFAWTWAGFNLAAGGPEERVRGMIASGAFFTTLGVSALAGRTFTPADDVRGGGPQGPVAVISYALWQRRFGGAASVIGSNLSIDHVPFTIIGVTPPEFFGIEIGESLDVVVPLGTDRLLKGPRTLLDNPGALLLTVMLRLRPDQSLASATSAIRAMQPQILGSDPSRLPQFLKEAYVLVPAGTGSTDKTQLRQRYEHPLLVMTAVVGLVLLIACVNIANLLLARAASRRHEFSVRLALGASRVRLARQLFVESFLLAAIGAVAGLIAGMVGSRLLVSQLSPSGDPMVLTLALDGRVIGFTAAVAAMTAVGFGTVPAFRATRIAPIDAMKGARAASALGRAGVSRGLVVVQVALSLVLLCAAGLFLETFRRLSDVPIGFDADRVLVATVDTSRVSAAPEDRDRFAAGLIAAAATAPSVAHAAASLATPGPGGGANLMTDARGRAVNVGRRILMNAVTPGWFSTYGVRMRAGRDFADTDTATGPPVAIVNETFARAFSPGRSVLGEELDDTSTNKKRTIVGFVDDVVYGSRRDEAGPQAYVPFAQAAGLGPPSARTLLQISVRTAGGTMPPIIRGVTGAIGGVDPRLSFGFRVVGDSERASLAQERLIAWLSGFFAMLAALLAALGLYGVTAYGVSRRETEIGVRLALGGSAGSIVRLVLSRTATLVVVGALVGVVASLWLSRFVAALVYGLEPRDPVIISLSVAVLAVVAGMAAWLPARRAARINPAELLRKT